MLLKFSKSVFPVWVPLILITQLIAQLFTEKIKKLFFLEGILRGLILWLILTTFLTVHQELTQIGNLLIPLVLTLTLITLVFFNLNNLIYFYIFFELSIVPIFIIILIWGYQRERFFASLSIFLYTFSASLPLLFSLMFLTQRGIGTTLNFILTNLIITPSTNFILTLTLILAFLVKTPIYLTHIWLPKAHVEAPVFGSMILAAILLKIGTFGLSLFNCGCFRTSFFWLILGLRTWSTSLIAAFCLKVIDIKVLVAYSSVSHIGFLIGLIYLNQQISLLRAIIIILTHGFTSSALFFRAHIIYNASNSRNTLFNKGVLHPHTYYLLWATILMSNIRAPPTTNFVAELLGVFALLTRNLLFSVLIISFIFFTATYTYSLFRITAQLNTNKSLQFTVSKKDLLILIRHIYPIFMVNFTLINFS